METHNGKKGVRCNVCHRVHGWPEWFRLAYVDVTDADGCKLDATALMRGEVVAACELRACTCGNILSVARDEEYEAAPTGITSAEVSASEEAYKRGESKSKRLRRHQGW